MKITIISVLLISVASAIVLTPDRIAFTAKVGDQLSNLSGFHVNANYSVLGYEEGTEAKEFLLYGSFASLGNEVSSIYVSQEDSTWFGFGSDNEPLEMKFDTDDKITNYQFYACKGVWRNEDNSAKPFTRISFKADAQPNCNPVDIYKVPILI